MNEEEEKQMEEAAEREADKLWATLWADYKLPMLGGFLLLVLIVKTFVEWFL
jgi:hypothetical protein